MKSSLSTDFEIKMVVRENDLSKGIDIWSGGAHIKGTKSSL